MSEHAILASSSAPQWGNCSGSMLAQQNRPNPESQETREGEAAHWVFAETVLNLQNPGRGPQHCEAFLGQIAPNGILIDEKMVEGAQVIVDDILAVCEQYPGSLVRVVIEHRVYMPQIHEHNWGTLDAALYLPEHGLLFIWDYKHGHREVRALNNLQLVDYLAGLVNEHDIDGHVDQFTTVSARIVQPFCYHALGPVNEWRVRLSDLRGAWNQLAVKAYEAFNDPKLSTGLWCRDCRAVGTCSAARRAGYNYVDMANEPYAMDAMSGMDLAVERDILKDGLAVAKARLEAVEDELHHRITGGETDSGLTVESTAGRLAWTVPPAQAIAIAGQFGVDASKQDVLTPTQTLAAASKEVKPLLKQILDGVTKRPAGSLKLVPVSESRTARAFQSKE